MKNKENQAIYNDKRTLYMNGEISHDTFYLWLATFIGANVSMIPFTKERIAKAIKTDRHLNNLPLGVWDNQDCVIRQLAYNKGLAWSLSDTVCVLKAVACHSVEA